MIRAIFWKEWREHRWKYAAYWGVLNLPILVAVLAIAISPGARAPFAGLADATAVKYLGVAVFAESGLLVTLFLIVTGFLAVATFRPELEDGSVFFLYEQPVSSGRYGGLKLLNGFLHTALAVSFAVWFAPAAAYALMVVSGKVTVAGSAGALAVVMAAAGRAAVWCSLISLAAFAGSALVAVLVPRWWLATAGSFVLIVLSSMTLGSFFDFIDPAFQKFPEGSSVTVGLSVGTAQWLTVTRALPLEAFAPWWPLPLLTAALLAAACAALTVLLYRRKEVK